MSLDGDPEEDLNLDFNRDNFQRRSPTPWRGRGRRGRPRGGHSGTARERTEPGVSSVGCREQGQEPATDSGAHARRYRRGRRISGRRGGRRGPVFGQGVVRTQNQGSSDAYSDKVGEPITVGRGRGVPAPRGRQTARLGGRKRQPERRRGGPFENADGAKNYRYKAFSIVELSTLEPEVLVRRVDSQLKEFQQTLGNAEIVKSESLDAVVLILSKLVKLASGPEGLEQSIATKVVAEILSAQRCAQFHFHLNQAVKSTACTFTQADNLCDIFNSMLNKFESLAWECLPVDELCETAKRLTKVSSNPSALLQKAEELCATRDQIRDSHSKSAKKPASDSKRYDIEFRFIPVLPEWKEIKEDKGTPPEVRPNKVDTPYKDWMEYYDIQFRLIREDFIAPLRRGVAAFLQGDKGKNNRDVTIYNAAKIISPVTTRDKGICFIVKFDVSDFHQYNWEQSKRLVFGSLLCFIPLRNATEDTIMFATVADSDYKKLRRGIFMVQFEGGMFKPMTHWRKGIQFEIVEPKSYFGATSPILQSIQRAEVYTMPFTKQLVKGKCNSVPPPSYLRYCESDIIYNLSCLHGPVKKRKSKTPLMIEVLNKESWEAARDSELDSSQLNAIQTALTQEIAVIQGPPGTGKTYIGLKIVEALLENRRIWNPRRSCPILVMCYTNHALDQFLEGIIETQCCGRKPYVIRVGGRCKNEKVDRHNLSKIRRYGYQHQFSSEFRWIREDMDRCNPDWVLERHFDTTGLLRLYTLQHIAHPYHYYQLTQMAQCAEQEGREIELWLGLLPEKFPQKLIFPSVEELHLEGRPEESQPYLLPEEELSQNDRERDLEGVQDDIMDYDDIEGFQIIRLQKRRLNNLAEVAYGHGYYGSEKYGAMEYEEVEKLSNVNIKHLGMRDRWRLYNYWKHELYHYFEEEYMENFEQYSNKCRELIELRQQEDHYILETADVIGMTTTGAAKYQHILQRIKPKIVIVEEAAEVLEAHIVSALSAGTQHLILIGDHKQLRPKPNEHVLATDYNLSISLFERLVMKQMSQATLEIQHRMRPEIAQLVCPHVYEKLLNHESVEKYPDIQGIAKNLFFVCHTEPEIRNPNSLSYQNEFEAKYIVGLCAHLLRQGYSPSQITILTPYVGQLRILRNTMAKEEVYGVHMTAIDNFQGEENDIILFSMVRSTNPNRSGTTIGFVKEDNRVCVSLSRAKQGFYAIGNFELIRHQSQLWESIISDVESRECYGNALPLYCCNHPETKYSAMKDSDFIANAPSGGCNRLCDVRLSCGHSCTQKCHGFDREHKEYRCKKSCKHTFDCGHTHTASCFIITENLFKCPTLCSKITCESGHECRKFCHYPEPCGPCNEMVTIQLPECSHEQFRKCSESMNPKPCSSPCKKTLSCGHLCSKKCSESCEYKCPEKITITLLCGHSLQCSCWEQQKNYINVCREKCSKILDCGHPCTEKCGSSCTKTCYQLVLKELPCGHKVKYKCNQIQKMKLPLQCPQKCNSILSCRHICSGKCGDCYSSRMHAICIFAIRLDRYCGHSVHLSCAGLSDACYPERHEAVCRHGENYSECHEPCNWKCRHFQCTKECSEECDRPPCNEPCDKKIRCGHRCPGLCGERCMSVCPQCDKIEFMEVFHPKPKKGYIPQNQPLFELECGHIFTVRYLDEYIQSKGPVVRSSQCHKCNLHIGVGNRYSNAVRRIMTDVWAIENVIRHHESVPKIEREKLCSIDTCKKLPDHEKTDPLCCLKSKIQRKLQDSSHPVTAEECCLVLCADLSSTLHTSLQSCHVRLDDIRESLKSVTKALAFAAKKYLHPGHQFRKLHFFVSYYDIHLSWQLLQDFMSEMYRLALSAQCLIAKSQLPPSSNEAIIEEEKTGPRCVVASVEQFIKSLNPLKDRICEKQYEEYFQQLSSAVPDVAHIHVRTPHMPTVVKGTWMKCQAGHYYCLPPVCGAGATRTDDCCPKCQKQ